jgi:hypothetical protein
LMIHRWLNYFTSVDGSKNHLHGVNLSVVASRMQSSVSSDISQSISCNQNTVSNHFEKWRGTGLIAMSVLPDFEMCHSDSDAAADLLFRLSHISASPRRYQASQ